MRKRPATAQICAYLYSSNPVVSPVALCPKVISPFKAYASLSKSWVDVNDIVRSIPQEFVESRSQRVQLWARVANFPKHLPEHS
jgi:hypothetical protein